ncbi:MAG: hypothetical protein LUH50_11465 [Bacteroides intestinalis]|nr:hypothetical protein [Bacteroides intestinalis]
MITLKRAKFESIAKLTMPEFFDTKNVVETELLDDWEKYAYHPDKPLTLDRVMDILEEQNDILLLYHFIPSKAILCSRSCCGISNPKMERMIKITATTDDRGLCDTIHLTIYNSLEIMLGDIINERKRMLMRYNFGFDESYCKFLSFAS